MFGLNILAQTADKGDATRWLDTLRPRALLVMDDSLYAEQLAQRFPQATVVHRAYRPDDHELDLKLSARAFVDTLSPIKTVFHQVINEPGGEDVERIPGLVAWLVEVMAEADRRGLRLCLLNYGMGQPTEAFIRDGLYDALLRAIFASRGRHILGDHEYLVDDANKEPWHIGRIREWNNRCAVIGIPPPPIVLTEVGRDVTGGNDGYRVTGWGGRGYAGRLDAAGKIWARFGNVIGACIFAHGPGFNKRWETYNTQGDSDLLSALAVINETGSKPMDFDWGTRDASRTVTNAGPRGANVRKSPDATTNTPVLVKLNNGDRITAVWSRMNIAGGYEWQQVELTDKRIGFVATTAGTFSAPVTTPVDPAPAPEFWEISFRTAQILKRTAGELRDKAIEMKEVADRMLEELKGVST